LRLTGWTIEGELPAGAGKSVLIAAPHTSNWDLPYTLMVAFALRLNVYWMGKAQLFRMPFGGLMRWLGGIPVNRAQASHVVAASVAALQQAPGPVQLIVPPEGTRSKTRHWRTGFYYIALGAQVPIVMAYMDYERKRSGLGPRASCPLATWKPTWPPSRPSTRPSKAATPRSFTPASSGGRRPRPGPRHPRLRPVIPGYDRGSMDSGGRRSIGLEYCN